MNGENWANFYFTMEIYAEIYVNHKFIEHIERKAVGEFLVCLYLQK